jgi:hypothetical protein
MPDQGLHQYRRLHQLLVAPAIFQGLVEGPIDIRATMVGQEIYAATIRTAQSRAGLDSRLDLDVPTTAYELPGDITRQLHALMAADFRARRRCQPLWIGSARRMVTLRSARCAGSWNGSWNGSLGNPSAMSAVSAMIRVICAARAYGARSRSSHNPSVVGSSPTRPTCGYNLYPVLLVDHFVDRAGEA